MKARKSGSPPNGRLWGFSLIELLIVVVIVGILLGIGIPSYRGYVQRTNRSDATAALLRIAAAQERFYLQQNQYADDLAAAPPGGLGISGTERGLYELTLATDNPVTDFTISASPAPGETQADDTECWTFTLNERGQQAAFDQAGDPNNETCWR